MGIMQRAAGTRPAEAFEYLLDEGSIVLRLRERSREEIIDELLGAAGRSLDVVDIEGVREAALGAWT